MAKSSFRYRFNLSQARNLWTRPSLFAPSCRGCERQLYSQASKFISVRLWLTRSPFGSPSFLLHSLTLLFPDFNWCSLNRVHRSITYLITGLSSHTCLFVRFFFVFVITVIVIIIVIILIMDNIKVIIILSVVHVLVVRSDVDCLIRVFFWGVVWTQQRWFRVRVGCAICC